MGGKWAQKDARRTHGELILPHIGGVLGGIQRNVKRKWGLLWHLKLQYQPSGPAWELGRTHSVARSSSTSVSAAWHLRIQAQTRSTVVHNKELRGRAHPTD